MYVFACPYICNFIVLKLYVLSKEETKVFLSFSLSLSLSLSLCVSLCLAYYMYMCYRKIWKSKYIEKDSLPFSYFLFFRRCILRYYNNKAGDYFLDDGD